MTLKLERYVLERYFSAVEFMKARFKKVVINEMSMQLRSHNTFQDFSYEGKIRDGPKIIKIIKINRCFFFFGQGLQQQF